MKRMIGFEESKHRIGFVLHGHDLLEELARVIRSAFAAERRIQWSVYRCAEMFSASVVGTIKQHREQAVRHIGMGFDLVVGVVAHHQSIRPKAIAAYFLAEAFLYETVELIDHRN